MTAALGPVEQPVQALIRVDILAGEVHTAPLDAEGRLQPVRTRQVGRHVGAAAPAAAGGYVLAVAAGFCQLDDDGTIRELAPCTPYAGPVR